MIILLPYIGGLPLRDVCNDAQEGFKDERAAEGAKNATINRSLEVVRTALNRATRVWRSHGKPWLLSSPFNEMLDERQQRRPPYPITWSEQAELMKHLPANLQRKVPELERSVFVIPAAEFKGHRPHVLILNDVATKSSKSAAGTMTSSCSSGDGSA